MQMERYELDTVVVGAGVVGLAVARALALAGRSVWIVDKEDSKAQYLYRGIATRGFERHFRLADHVEVQNANLEHGLLKISLKRHIPKEELVKKITINQE